MSNIADHQKMRRTFRLMASAALIAVSATAAFIQGAFAADANNRIPDFVAGHGGWTMINTNATNYNDPASGPKGVSNDPRYPHVGNLQPGQKTDRVADANSPILQQWAKDQIAKTNEPVLRGRTPFVATSLCWPAGVPTYLLVPNTIFFLQTADMVIMMSERDQQVRRIYLNQPHQTNPKPQWYGDAVGHYEGGDTLVIDTIGLSDHPLSFVDNFRTPHTKALHVVERWKMNGGFLEVSFTVEDPGTFTTVWGGSMRYRYAAPRPIEEVRCAENDRDFGLDDFKIPQDNTPDF